jgi:hypothetical protein
MVDPISPRSRRLTQLTVIGGAPAPLEGFLDQIGCSFLYGFLCQIGAGFLRGFFRYTGAEFFHGFLSQIGADL